MRPLALAAVLLALAPAPARAATLLGGDYGGQPLTPANGDTLSGVFTNVSVFTVGAGTTVFAAPGTPLVVYAATVQVRGVIDGVGRGQPGGNGGAEAGAGFNGFGSGPGLGAGAAASGGGGSHGGRGGAGAGALAGSTSAVYGAAAAFTVPVSSDDAAEGSGGGGGGGAPSGFGGGGAAGNGGAAVYIEAASMTVTGSILVTGSTAATVAGSVNAGGDVPGAGGGGAGGGLVLRVTRALSLEGATLNAAGGSGGRISDPLFCRNASPGGGGGGGRVKVYSRAGASFTASISTSGGSPGVSDCVTGFDSPTASTGLAGTVSFGRVAAAPSGFAASSVYVSSIAWYWTNSADMGDGAGPLYRVFPGTATAPLVSPHVTAAETALQTSATEQSLTPNTTYYRAVTAYTAWGDSALSGGATAFTLASEPAPSAFSSVGSAGLTVNWTDGSPDNPSYTQYTLQGSTDPAFGGGGGTDLVALSSSPSGLAANTTYYYRVRAVNVQAVPTAWSASFATATLAATPVSPSFGAVHISSVALVWSAAGNPAGTLYQAEASSDAFATVAGSSSTLNTSATFFALNTGTVFAFRVRAVNRNSVPTAYTTAISTAAGLLTDTSPPSAPGRPAADVQFSYDGTVTWSWTPASSGVGILKYKFFLGTTPGGDDVISNLDVFVTSHSVAGLATGRTYYALVLPVSNAGVNGFASDPSQGTPVFLPAQEPRIPKPFSWPNPFDPAAGPAQIGVYFEEAADVTLKFYDLQGRLVHESATRAGAGNQILSWDGTRSGGGRVAPGGYIGVVQKRYGARTDTQKFKLAVLY